MFKPISSKMLIHLHPERTREVIPGNAPVFLVEMTGKLNFTERKIEQRLRKREGEKGKMRRIHTSLWR